MDLSKNGRSWVGNICNQIETMLQDVDNLARQETVKFVANQVNSVGDSVKRFYSDVVQDVLPSPEKNLKLEERLETSPQVDAGSHVESDIGTGTEPVCINKEDQLLVEQGPFIELKNSNASVSIPSEYCVTEFTDPPATSPSQEMLTYLPLKEDCDVTILSDVDNTFEDCIDKDLIQATANADSSAELSDTYCNPKIVMLPVVESSYLSSSEIQAFWSYFNSLTDDGLPKLEARNSTPMLVSDCDADHRALNEDKTLCDVIPSEDTRLDVSGQTTELVFSYSSCGDEEVETCDIFSTCSASLKPLKIEEFMSEDFTQQAENVSSSQVDSYGSACNKSAPSSTTWSESEATNTLPVMELNDANSFSSSKSVSNAGQSQSRHESCCEDAQSKTALSVSETMDILPVIESNDLKSSATSKPVSTICQSRRSPGFCHDDARWISSSSHSESGNSSEFGDGVIVHGMETIDLSNDVKHDGRDLILNSNFAVPSNHRRRNFRYYKNLITDALGSRKRLSKEYKHLGVLCGDIDMESRHDFDLSLVHSYTRSDTFDMSESDWELL